MSRCRGLFIASAVGAIFVITGPGFHRLAAGAQGAPARGVIVGDPDSQPVPMRVRSADQTVSRLLLEGGARSATFAALLNRLGGTSWLVFVDRGRCPERAAVGCLLHTVRWNGGKRSLHILVNQWRLGHPDMEIGVIAHELQHAIEAAEAPEVIEEGDLAGLFRRIGYVSVTSGRAITYETEAARQVGDDVLEELHRSSRIADSRRPR